jgi:hypothetical protein
MADSQELGAHAMTQDKYGNHFSEHFLEQYKLYVRMADNVSSRRSQTNAFFISVLSALLVILSLTGEKSLLKDLQDLVFLSTSLMGLLLCWVWALSIRSYRQLNSGKFAVIHEMEQQLPFRCYGREWEILGRGEKSKKYVRLTRVERYVLILLAAPFLLIVVYVSCRFFLS